MSTRIVTEDLEGIDAYFASAPEAATQAAVMAINDIARGSALRMARDEMNQQINFPHGYLGADRLYVGKLARSHDLEAVIVGRDRATSLARFAVNPKPGQRGVQVEVHKGERRTMKKAFIVRLRAGRSMDGQSFNLGLAIRLAPGEKLYNRREAGNVNYSVLREDKNGTVVLLYGPSVDQVFSSVAADISPAVSLDLAAEFFRQFERLSNG